jgi:ferredoxin-NADP reductase
MATTPAAPARVTLPLASVATATPRTRVLRLGLGDVAFPFHAGQAVLAGRHGQVVRKPYSIACAPHQAAAHGVLELLVQADPDGGEPHLESLAPGVLVDVEGPFGSFALPAGGAGPLVLIAGGTGIAPLRAMLWEELAAAAPRPVTVIYSARAREEFAFADELEQLAADRRITLHLTVTRQAGDDWQGYRGRVDAGLLMRLRPGTDARWLLCGPQAFVSDLARELEALGVPHDHVVVER